MKQSVIKKLFSGIQKIFGYHSKGISNPDAEKTMRKFEHHRKHVEDKSVHSIDSEIRFSKYFHFGSSKKLVMNLSGKPLRILESENFGVEVLIYRLRVHNCDVRFELHFQNERLFHIHYAYTDISDLEKEKVIRSLSGKYGVRLDSADVFDQVIRDNQGNTLHLDNEKGFSVNYLAAPGLIKAISVSENSMQQAAI